MMKKWLKNQKGLTLLELLAVIVVLGIIAAIAIPAINGTIKNQKENADKASEQLILDATLRYLYDEYPNGPASGSTQNVSVATLKSEGYLNSNFQITLQSDSSNTYSDVTGTYTATGGWTVPTEAAYTP